MTPIVAKPPVVDRAKDLARRASSARSAGVRAAGSAALAGLRAASRRMGLEPRGRVGRAG
ncbi:MAG: hypothetical protein ACKORL_01220 [Phycisphaerales bacterium]